MIQNSRHVMVVVEAAARNLRAPIYRVSLLEFDPLLGMIKENQLHLTLSDKANNEAARGPRITARVQLVSLSPPNVFNYDTVREFCAHLGLWLETVLQDDTENVIWSHEESELPTLRSLFEDAGIKYPFEGRTISSMKTLWAVMDSLLELGPLSSAGWGSSSWGRAKIQVEMVSHVYEKNAQLHKKLIEIKNKLQQLENAIPKKK